MSNEAFDLWLAQNVEPNDKDGLTADEQKRFTALDKKISNKTAAPFFETPAPPSPIKYQFKGLERVQGSPKSVEVAFSGVLGDEDLRTLEAHLRAWLG